jgi:hypothetical protein
MEDADAVLRDKKRPMLGGGENPSGSSLEFVTEGTGDDPFGLGDLLTGSSKKPKQF